MKKEISYELIGWEGEDHREHTAAILRSLHESKEFGKIESYTKSELPFRLQIILQASPHFKPLLGENPEPVSWMVERKPGEFSVFLLNRILAVRTLFIVPLFRKADHTVIFRFWVNNKQTANLIYPLETLEVFGWISFMLSYFDDHETIDKMYYQVGRRFISDIRGNF